MSNLSRRILVLAACKCVIVGKVGTGLRKTARPRTGSADSAQSHQCKLLYADAYVNLPPIRVIYLCSATWLSLQGTSTSIARATGFVENVRSSALSIQVRYEAEFLQQYALYV